MKIKRYICLIFVLILQFGCSSSDDNVKEPEEKLPEGVEVKAMTYNIYSGVFKGIEGIAQVINEVDPDIVGLEEFETNSKKQPFDVIKRFLELTDMTYYYFAKTHNLDKGEYGNLILSKYPLSNGKTFDLGVVVEEGSYPRNVGIVETEKDGKSFYFAVTHLDHLGEDTNRNHQVEQILKHTSKLDKPIIMVGDFNALQGSDPLNTVLQEFTLGCIDGNCGKTTGALDPVKAIDYLMYAPKDAITTKSYGVYYDAFTESDHFPVVATFIIHD